MHQLIEGSKKEQKNKGKYLLSTSNVVCVVWRVVCVWSAWCVWRACVCSVCGVRASVCILTEQ